MSHPHRVVGVYDAMYGGHTYRQWECACGETSTEADDFAAGMEYGKHLADWQMTAPKDYLGFPTWIGGSPTQADLDAGRTVHTGEH